MKILYYDCFCGISGDMNLAALIDLGVDEEYLKSELSKLSINDEFELKVSKSEKFGINGTRVDVILINSKKDDHHEHPHAHPHGDSHEHPHVHNHEHLHVHNHKQKHEHSHDVRNLEKINKIIDDSFINENIKKISKEIFMKVAIAEAKVHGKSLNEVHFHEVGATDSIVDIVGAAICIDYLKVDKIMASKVHVGGGVVKCDHGVMPVPAPATAEILKDVPIVIGRVLKETTTPTGAAILAANVSEYTDEVDFTIDKIGYGIGHNDFNIPNVLRVYLSYENEETSNASKQIMIETNIDDMNPEIYDYIEEKLLNIGALDVFRTPIIMKKGRNGVKLSVLAREKDAPAIEEAIFRNTSSIGLRKYEISKSKMDRVYNTVMTKFGAISIKTAFIGNEVIKYKAEYEDCKKAANENNVTINEVYTEVARVVEFGGK